MTIWTTKIVISNFLLEKKNRQKRNPKFIFIFIELGCVATLRKHFYKA